MSETGNSAPAKPALSERVRSLRLAESHDSGSGGGWRLYVPWAICALLFCVGGVLALEAFSPLDDELLKKLAEERGLNVGKGGADASASKLIVPGGTGTSAGPVEIALESKGNVVPFKLIQISPKITGTVMKLNIKEGMAVEKNFELAVLEDVEFKSDLDGAVARLKVLEEYRKEESTQAKAELDDAVAQLVQSQFTWDRARELKKTNGISPTEYEAAEGTLLSLKARVKKLEIAYDFMAKRGPRDAQIASAKADLDKAKWRYDNIVIKAPIDGIILSKKTEEGNLVNPSAFSSGLSASLCEMADLYDLEIDLSIAERDIAKVFENQEVRIRAEAYPERIYPGYVSRIMPTADRNKASVPVRAKVLFPATDKKGKVLAKEKQGEYLRPEMGAIVTFLNRKSSAAVAEEKHEPIQLPK
jgi:multidrug resistance efflux pump